MRKPQEKDLIEGIIRREGKRQEETLNLIASENYIPAYIRNASTSVLMQKYAEGYPGKRYYPGTTQYDHIEKIARKRALELFGLSEKNWHVNVQPYSGAIANMEIYLALLQPGDTILSMKLSSGGHLSHGSAASFTGKLFHAEHYGVTDAYDIDYAELAEKIKKTNPALVVSGASAFPKKIDFKKIGMLAESHDAFHLADISHYAGLVSAKAYPSPFAYADVVMMTTHKSLFGPRGAVVFVNKKSKTAKQKGVDIVKAIDKVVFPGMQGGPHMHTIAGIAMGLSFAKENKQYFMQVVKNARALALAFAKKKYKIYGNGTDSHMVLVDVSKKKIDGKRAEEILETCGILANRNTVQGDVSVQRPSAIRLGTYALTYRGMGEREMKEVADLVDQALTKENFYENIRTRVKELTRAFPIPYDTYDN